MTRFLERQAFWVTPLSPIHIGSAVDVDWTSAFVEPGRLVLFDPLRVTLSAQLAAALTKCIDQSAGSGNAGTVLVALQKLYRDHQKVFAKAEIADIAIPPRLADDIAGKFGHNVQRAAGPGEVRINTINTINAIAIARTVFNNLCGRAIIPGSSMKGALKTAWVDHRLGQGARGEKDKDILGGRFQTDPFRLLSVEDCVAGDDVATCVVVARNVKRTSSQKGKGLPVKVEVISPLVAGAFRGAWRRTSLDGKMAVQLPSLKDLAIACTAFHRGRFDSHTAQMRNLGVVDQPWLNDMTGLVEKTMAAELDSGSAMLIRLGKFCPAEFKTRRDCRIRVKVSRSDCEDRDKGTTFWLAGDDEAKTGQPFGWALVEFADEPSQKVRDWCAAQAEHSGAGWPVRSKRPAIVITATAPEVAMAAPPASRIVAAATTDNEEKLERLENELERQAGLGKTFKMREAPGPMIENYLRQASRGWSAAERLLLVRLIEEKAMPLLSAPGERSYLERRLGALKQ
ncbi:MAG: RAMP superfamily CRISPR-associated protein [Azospirillaceae bacterium]|nr:RAMP superfamily CRISPR-associated protein [Azospirillaceae bacterium]